MLSQKTSLGTYEYIDKDTEVSLILSEIDRCKYISLDTENSGGLDSLNTDVRLLLLQLEVAGKAYVIDIRKVDINLFRSILSDKRWIKIIQNSNYDFKLLKYLCGIPIRGIFDTMIAESLLQAGLNKGGISLVDLALRYSEIRMNKEIVTTFIDHPYDAPFTNEQLRYAADDVLVLPDIHRQQQLYLNQYSLNQIAEIEFALVEPVAEMELIGIKIDADMWRRSLDNTKKKLFIVSNELREALPNPPAPPLKPLRIKKDGTPFANSVKVKPPPVLNIDSWQQLTWAFNEIGIDLEEVNKKTRKGLTNSSTIKFAQTMYHNDLVKLKVLKNLMVYRTLNQVNKTFGDNLLEHMQSDGRIHAKFWSNGTASGRFSSSDPNIQNIQKKGEEGKILRSCFVPNDGYKYVISDFSQIELRIAAELSNDPVMLAILQDPKGDIHRATASQMYNVPYDKVSGDLRRAAKTVNFGIIYGMQIKTLSERLDCSFNEASKHLSAYTSTYKVMMDWLEDAGNKAYSSHSSKTIGGRIRWFPELKLSNFETERDFYNMVEYYKRVGRNHPVQGCLKATTKVMTKRGYIPIIDFKSSTDEVWTGNNWAKAELLNRGKAEIVNVYLNNGQKLEFDVRHKLLVNVGAFPEWMDIMDTRITKYTLAVSGCPTSDDLNIEDSEFWYWMGRYYGDGYIYYKNEYKNHKYTISWSFSGDEVACCDRFIRYWSGRGLHVTRQVDKRSDSGKFSLTISSKKLLGTLSDYGICAGVTAGTKRLTNTAFLLNAISREAILQGYFDSDGTRSSPNSEAKTFTSIGFDLLNGMLLLAHSLGNPAWINGPYKHADNRLHNDFYKLRIGMINSDHRRKGLIKQVVKVERTGIFEDTYTLSVNDNNHSFDSEGLISKNTSADITKIAIVLMYLPLLKLGATVVNVIHDELCIEVPKYNTIKVAKIVKDRMILAGQRYLKKVPVLVDVKIRDCWFKDDFDAAKLGIQDDEDGQQLWLMPNKWGLDEIGESVDGEE